MGGHLGEGEEGRTQARNSEEAQISTFEPGLPGSRSSEALERVMLVR